MVWHGITEEVDEENVQEEQKGDVVEREPDNRCE